MITVNSNKINTFNQISYNKLINSIRLNLITCSCGHSGCLTKYAYYRRSLKIAGEKITISVLRLICSVCGKTHAVFPDTVVPCSRISMADHIIIINNDSRHILRTDVMNNNPLIDESSISYITGSFRKYWLQRLKVHRMDLNMHVSRLVNMCFKYFSRRFMQIKCTTNILYTPTHIT